MNKYTTGLHHYHIRKRIHKKQEAYPYPNKWKIFIDKAIYPIGILGPLLSIPQLLNIWVSKDAGEVSLITWGSFLVTAVFWLVYGILHKEKPIIISYTIWIVIEVGVIIGIILYK